MEQSLFVPSDYRAGYRAARDHDPARADNYVAHTTVGDPEADALIGALREYGEPRRTELIAAVIEGDRQGLEDAPPELWRFVEAVEGTGDRPSPEELMPAVRMFHRNSNLALAAFVAGVLVDGFSTSIGKPFFITGRLRDQGIRRLRQNNR